MGVWKEIAVLFGESDYKGKESQMGGMLAMYAVYLC